MASLGGWGMGLNYKRFVAGLQKDQIKVVSQQVHYIHPGFDFRKRMIRYL